MIQVISSILQSDRERDPTIWCTLDNPVVIPDNTVDICAS